MNDNIRKRHLTVVLIILCTIGITSRILSAEPNEPFQTDELFDMSIEDLMNVDISVASKKDEPQYEAPGVVAVVPREEIEFYGDRNLHQLLQRQPSVFTRGSYMYPYNIASFRGNMATHLDLHTLILFNGRPIRESAFGGINFPAYMNLPLKSLEGVEIIRGPGSVLYGTNAFTGVVNLKPRIPEADEFSISSMIGSYGYYQSDVTAGGKSDGSGYMTTFRMAGQQGYAYRLTDGMGIYDTDSDTNRSVSGIGHFYSGKFTFDFFATSMETFHVGVLPFWAVPGHVYRVNKLFTNAGYRTDLNEKIKMDLNLTYNVQENDFAGFPTGDVSLNSSDLLGEATFFIDPVDNLNFVLGYLVEYQASREGNAYESIPIYNHKPQSAYVQGDYKIGKLIKLITGLQWNRSSQGVSDLISRYGIIITPNEKWGVKLLRGEAFRAPFALEADLYDIPVLVGNSNLEPEAITTYDAQIFYTGDKTYTAITYFDSSIDRLIVRDTSVSPTSFKNGGEQQFQGVEFELKRFLTSRWHVLGSFMYQESDEDNDINPSTVPHDMLKIGTGYNWDWGTLGVFYSYFGAPPRLKTENVVNPKPDRLHLASINLTLDPSQRFGYEKERVLFTFRIENLFNEEIYVPEFNRSGNPNSLPDGPGTTFYAGMTYRF
jgi:outer membrane receptor protein involved in Fe transport